MVLSEGHSIGKVTLSITSYDSCQSHVMIFIESLNLLAFHPISMLLIRRL